MENTPKFDVAIVGMDLVGLSLANLLTDYALSVLVIDQQGAAATTPTNYVDDESLRIFQAVDQIDAMDRCALSVPKTQILSKKKKVLYELKWSDKSIFGFPEANLLNITRLRESLLRRLEKAPHCSLLQYQEIRSIGENETGSQIQLWDTNIQEEKNFTAAYTVLTEAVSVWTAPPPLSGKQALELQQRWLVIEGSINPQEDSIALPNFPQQIASSKQPSIYFPGPDQSYRFEFLLDETLPASLLDQERGVERSFVEGLLGQQYIDPAHFNLESASPHFVDCKINSNWSKGKIILAGNAAYQQARYAGLQLNNGLKDVHNLAWKLAWILKGQSSEQLLHSYQVERLPHLLSQAKLVQQLNRLLFSTNSFQATLRNIRLSVSKNSYPILKKIQQNGFRNLALQEGFLGTNHPLAGQLSIQPEVMNNIDVPSLLDSYFGNQMILLGRLAPEQKKIRPYLNKIQLKQLVIDTDFYDFTSSLINWFDEHKVDFVLIRPDRYVYDAGKIGELPGVLEEITVKLKT